MDTSALKSFAQNSRRRLIKQVSTKLQLIIASDSDARRVNPEAIRNLEKQIAKHGGFSLVLTCNGDLEVDEHHTVEDVALALGKAFSAALGDKRGIGRYGFTLPMDEAQAQVALDLAGRAVFRFAGEFPRDSVGELPTEMVVHFFRSLSDSLGAALHISVEGENTHHMVEGCFKATGRALRQAKTRHGTELPSTKGTL